MKRKKILPLSICIYIYDKSCIINSKAEVCLETKIKGPGIEDSSEVDWSMAVWQDACLQYK